MAADFPQQHWHQTSSVFMFMALFTIRAHLTGYWAPPDKERSAIRDRSRQSPLAAPWLHLIMSLDCVDSRASVLGIIVIIITYKNDPGGLWPFRNEAPPVYYETEGKHSHCDKLVMITTSPPSGVSHPVLPWWAARWLCAFTVPVDITVKIDTAGYNATACVW